ncbi:MAG TPA: neutral/alkaline non-lysosomal ceramidase N-terminal domain-containing protein [Terriglobales bacterium]|nr:neutral/alkaline non-lysosomal ceramidase N-terminal domain-containing protein [Terriglobales bacterium]
MRNKPSLFCGIAIASLVIATALSTAQMGPLRAGAAKVDVSPSPNMFPLTGMQSFVGLHDPLYARALVLDNGSNKVALITVDSVGIVSGDELTNALANELKIPATNLIVSATHDHNTPLDVSGGFFPGTGPPTKSSYFEILKEGLLKAVRQADANLQPARIGFGTGRAYVNSNRNWKIDESVHGFYNPEGPSDKTVAVLIVTNLSGEPFAIYTNYAVHSVVMFQSKTKDGNGEVTGDLAGWTSNYVEDHTKGVVALWTMGAAGDQNPVFMSLYNQAAPGIHDEGPSGWAILDVLSRRLGEETVRVAKSIQNTTREVTLWGMQTSVACPGRKPAEPLQFAAVGSFLTAAFWDKFKMVDSEPAEIPLHLIMVNDIAIAGVSAEVFTEIGEHFKRDSLFDRAFMVTNLPGGAGFYIPTDAGYLIPVSETRSNRLKPGCAEQAIIGGFLSMQESYLSLGQKSSK